MGVLEQIREKLREGHTSLSHWLEQNSQVIGAKYASEVRKLYRGAR